MGSRAWSASFSSATSPGRSRSPTGSAPSPRRKGITRRSSPSGAASPCRGGRTRSVGSTATTSSWRPRPTGSTPRARSLEREGRLTPVQEPPVENDAAGEPARPEEPPAERRDESRWNPTRERAREVLARGAEAPLEQLAVPPAALARQSPAGRGNQSARQDARL